MTTSTRTNPGELNTISAPSAKVQEYRNVALNIMEDIRRANSLYAKFMEDITPLGLNIDRLPNESQFNHCSRLATHLAVIEGEQFKSEILNTTRSETDALAKPHSSENVHQLPVHRKTSWLGKKIQTIANHLS